MKSLIGSETRPSTWQQTNPIGCAPRDKNRLLKLQLLTPRLPHGGWQPAKSAPSMAPVAAAHVVDAQLSQHALTACHRESLR